MTSTRPYRRALPTFHALGEIERCAGNQFDPEIAHAFLRAWRAGAFANAAAM
jgi:HD-GYP domain-containing protein (c-di-GMP phosphodiesterase class II)